jgi:multicomponent Na+:H+ antiporter subunit E
MRQFLLRWLGLAAWAYAVWLVLTWTATAEQLVFGAILVVIIGASLAPLGAVVGPWRAMGPRRLGAIVWLVADGVGRIVRANLSLSRRIWSPGRPLHSGMMVTATSMHGDAGLAWTGLISSLIVDNQIVDLDRDRHELQYHAVAVPPGGMLKKAEHANAPVERHLARVIGEDA